MQTTESTATANGLTINPDGSATLFIDNTTLEAHQSCRRRFMYYAIRRIIPNAPNASLLAGGALHEGLRAWYTCNTLNAAADAIAVANETHPLVHDDWRNLDLVNRAMQLYAKTYPHEPFEIVCRNTGPLVEVPFAVPFGHFVFDKDEVILDGHEIHRLDILYTGKIDLIVRFNGVLHVVDHKTTSVAGDSFVQQFELSGQPIGYCNIASDLLNEPVTSFLLNAINWRPPTQARDSTIHLFRTSFSYHEELLAEWRTDVAAQVEDIVDGLLRHSFPKHTSQCFPKYGRCPYHAICTVPPSQRELMTQSELYKPATWSPLN